MDFPAGLVNSVLNLSDGQVKFFEDIQITEVLLEFILVRNFLGTSKNDFRVTG